MGLSTVTTEDLIADIARDADNIHTFYARAEFTKRTRSDWRAYAPAKHRWKITTESGGPVHWHNFHENG